jgi:outer membrane protein TolC
MEMKYFALVVFFLMISGWSRAQGITLFDCWDLSRDHYPLVKGKEVLAESTDLNIRNIKSKWFPQMQMTGQASWQNDVAHVDAGNSMAGFSIPKAPKDQYKIVLDVNQTIYDGGRTSARSSLETVSCKVEDQDLEVQLNSVRNRVADLFFSILMLDKQNLQIKHKLETVRARCDELQALLDNGAVEPGEVKTLDAELLLIRQQFVALQYSIDALLDNLSSYTGRDITNVALLQLPSVGDFIAPEERPEYELFRLQQNQLQESSVLTKRDRWPALAAFGQAGYGNPGYNMLKNEFDAFYMIGLRLKWTPWDWKETKRKAMVLTNNSQLIDIRRETFRVNQMRTFRQLNGEIDQYLKMMEFDNKIVELRDDIAQQSAKKLLNGTITSADYMTDLDADVNAKTNRDLHELQYLQALASKYITGNETGNRE